MPKKSKNVKITDRNKAWNRGRNKRQEVEDEGKEKRFLIVCEGQNTEPAYFLSFPVETAIITSFGLGSSKTRLVEMVIELRKKDKQEEVWVVFDMDIERENAEKIKSDYENAIALAESKNIKIAYSNDAFEIWFLLHYQYFDNQWTRHEYYDKLSEWWGCNYEKMGKNIAFAQTIYKRLEEDESADQAQAVSRAEKLLENQQDMNYAEKNPATNAHSLVEELNKHF